MVLRPPGGLPIASVTMATTHQTAQPGDSVAVPEATHAPLPSQGDTGRARTLTVLVYSDDSTVREAVRLAVGRRPAADLPAVQWIECATEAAVVAEADAGRGDVLVLDGEAVPYGGLGISRQLKNEIYRCPPILVLTGRREDAWLASWSQADLAVPHPLDPAAVAAAVAELARRRLG
jgi:DNA-binding response OmpR family regulator